MDRQTFEAAWNNGPVVVTMNDGSKRQIVDAVVDDISAHVLTPDADPDGKRRAKILSLVAIVSIESAE